MTDRRLEPTCRECGRPLSFHAGETRPARCEQCFDDFLRARDVEFLSSYAELGVTSRRTIAETCFRALAMDNPQHRKVLAMNIMEQYVHTAGDLIGLYAALKQRGREPIMRAFLDFKLDHATAIAFFREIASTPAPELLASLGLPMPEGVAARCPSLSKSDVKDLKRAMDQMLYDLAYTVNPGESAALALAQMAGESRIGPALANQSMWLDNVGLRKDQVASFSLDERRRTINITAITVDEKKLENVISTINAMTRAAQNLIYAVLTMYQEDDRVKEKPRAAKPPVKR
ncbi:MAG: hypothetical protein WEB52_13080 [Dehalococcoidia bacterium]